MANSPHMQAGLLEHNYAKMILYSDELHGNKLGALNTLHYAQ